MNELKEYIEDEITNIFMTRDKDAGVGEVGYNLGKYQTLKDILRKIESIEDNTPEITCIIGIM